VDRRILKQKSFILLQTKCVPEWHITPAMGNGSF
jgi:hypothetical protein